MFPQQQQQQQQYQQNGHVYLPQTNFNESMFFNPDLPQEICPNVWLGPYSSLRNYSNNKILEQQKQSGGTNTSFLAKNKGIKMIINCGTTAKFLDLIENSIEVSISSDIMILSIDPAFDPQHQNEQVLISEFTTKFNRILQNYLSYFYIDNPSSINLIHQLPKSHDLTSIKSPLFTGSNLKIQFFKIVRLISLFKYIFNHEFQILILSESGDLNLSTGLTIAYLMDNYKYNLNNSFRLIKEKRPTVMELKLNFYDDLLIVEHLKKFYLENIEIKVKNPQLLINKVKRKNSLCENDGGCGNDGDEDDAMRDEIMVGGDRKRRLH
ncbi:hypothetical protein KGF56_003125 [Candida oxycetoniae]|uniref:Uncharacterized protein n=1 Tax=Candida oxycetoniae TaxID=497107 RepID=A0AAI9SWD1_9ASCO|nr:uncharacterized protein KGF56_003125 [Candida oxycetoniae]KAI3404089.2 hypothetical protein KGF56_003125 [Candida oxycetoniae]